MTDPERWRRIEDLFHAALARAASERAAFLDEGCAGDAALRQELESLLTAQTAEGFLAEPIGEVAANVLGGVAGDWSAAMVGQTISHYQILEELGSGGMGVVYKAVDLRLNRFVALKFLLADRTRDEEATDRFRREAQAASALDHSNICIIHEIDETPDHRVFLTMAYYDGETLKQRIERGPLSVKDAIDIAIQVAQALSRAHGPTSSTGTSNRPTS